VGSDIAIVEGVRGLYEGLEALSDTGSTAQIAKLLKTPVVLVLDAQSITRSTAAIVKGYKDFDRGINFKGVILNKVGSDRHAEKATAAIQKYTGVEVLGAIPRNKGMSLTMRHLGLVPAREGVSRVEDFGARIGRIKEIDRAATVQPRPPAGDRERRAEDEAGKAGHLQAGKKRRRPHRRGPGRGVQASTIRTMWTCVQLKAPKVAYFSPLHR